LVWIEDYPRAQQLLEQQLQTNWAELLERFARQLNPQHQKIFARYPASYYWTCYQSEWATDVVFREAGFLKRLMPLLVRHGMLSFDSADVMRYFGKKVNQSGTIPANFSGTLETDVKRRQPGERVKYRMNGNSATFYDKAYSETGSVLRGAETTINTGEGIRIYRPKEGGPEDIQKPTRWGGRRVRALRPWAEDKGLLTAINPGDFLINGFRNRDLQKLLYGGEAESAVERRRRSAAVSRKLRMLRARGLIRKVPRTPVTAR